MNIHRSGVVTELAWLVPHETAAISVRSVYTIQPCTMSLHAKPHTQGAYLAVTCQLHFWQNDRDLLRATEVTRRWNGYRNKSAKKFDPGEENSLAAPAGIRTATFQSRARRYNHRAIPTHLRTYETKKNIAFCDAN